MSSTKLVQKNGTSGRSTGPMKGPGSRHGLLVETLQLVEQTKHQSVPNHILETKIYSKAENNSIVRASPAAVHFNGFETGSIHQETLDLINVSTQVQRMHIIPPQSEYFTIKYTKGDRLVPGMAITCTIEFSPDEWRYYYDSIRIHTPGEENLLIPIHAYPLLNTSEWPELLDFQFVPVGQMKSKVIPLRCQAPVDFEFELVILQHHPAFTIDPKAGVVPANGEVDIVVTFRPSEFSTAQMKIQLSVSQFDSKSLICTIMGRSKPGMAKELMKVEDEPLDPQFVTPSGRARLRRQNVEEEEVMATKSSSTIALVQDTRFKDIVFPSNLDNPHAVAMVLIQEPGRLRIKDLREAIAAREAARGIKTRQMKYTRKVEVAIFEKEIRENVHEERQNTLRWQVRLGDDPISQLDRQEILADRQCAVQEYNRKRGEPVPHKEQKRQKTEAVFRCTRRNVDRPIPEDALFDIYSNNIWPLRMDILSRFQQGTRKLLLRIRTRNRLVLLKELMKDIIDKQQRRDRLLKEQKKRQKEEKEARLRDDKWFAYAPPCNTDQPLDLDRQNDEDLTELMEEDIGSKLRLNPRGIRISTQMTIGKGQKQDPRMRVLDIVPYFETELELDEDIDTLDLEVPIEYQFKGFSFFHLDEAASYIPPGLQKPLRTGAEEEIIIIEVMDDPQPATAAAPATQPQTKATKPPVDEPGERQVQAVERILPPRGLWEPVPYPPMHVFNPTPGLHVFEVPLPYSEIDLDFHLCPLPSYNADDPTNPHVSTQKEYLDRQDVIKGMMTYKRFPSQGLIALSSTPTLTTVWVPRWEDAFDPALLPTDIPALQASLSPSDEENIEDETDLDRFETCSKILTLSPEMVNNQFPQMSKVVAEQLTKSMSEDMFPNGNRMPPTNIPVGLVGPVPREKREQELDYFLTKKSNRLGGKFIEAVGRMNGVKNNGELILQERRHAIGLDYKSFKK